MINGFTCTDGEEQLWAKLHAVCKERLGTTNILYGFTHSVHLGDRVGFTKSLILKHSYPAEYVATFKNGNLLDDDAASAVLLQGNGPFIWQDLEQHMSPTDAHYERVAVDYAFDFSVGVSLGFKFNKGNGVAGMGLASSGMSPQQFVDLWKSTADDHIALLTEFDSLMRPAMVANRLKLTPREKQCLKLSVGGMNAKEIAHHLGISEGSVFNIMERARKSMQAGNTIEAVAKALAYDLL
jgi:DNA-binding CsgD family transcriptional regulator